MSFILKNVSTGKYVQAIEHTNSIAGPLYTTNRLEAAQFSEADISALSESAEHIAEPRLLPHHMQACDIAADRVLADPDSTGKQLIGATKDLNSRGNGPIWYRMVWRAGEWRYVSDERLPSGSFLARDRRATVYGEVFPGELTLTHDHGAAVDSTGSLISVGPDGKLDRLDIDIVRTRDGQLKITLPDGTVLKRPNPRK